MFSVKQPLHAITAQKAWMGAVIIVALVILGAGFWFLFWQTAATDGTKTPYNANAPAFLKSDALLARPDEPLLPIALNKNLNAEKVALGRMLFHDPRLSVDNSISCAFCHDLNRSGADNLVRSRGVGGVEGNINAPTVFNSSLNFRQFWDGRAATLEEQAAGPIHNPSEMSSSWEQVISKLGEDEEMKKRFLSLYKSQPTPEAIQNAIAEFERSLITPSRMDSWLMGEESALTPQELAGYQLFKQYGCVACHQGANVGGNMYQRFGVMYNYFAGRQKVEPADMGRFNVTVREEDRYVFKVPSLRNVALTPPYFHDGSTPSLHEAVSKMGYYQLGIELPKEDVQSIVLFLNTLTGERRE